MSGPLVIKVGGTTLEDSASAPGLWRAIVQLHHSHAAGVVLVHGGGKAVDRLIEKLGFVNERREGIRITPADQLDVIAGVLAGTINKSLVGSLNAAGAKAVGLCLGDGREVTCVKASRYSFDPGRVGEVTGGEASLLRLLLHEKYLPVLCSIGLDSAGLFLNINADDGAASIATILGADALILLTDVPGILDGKKRLLAEVTAPRIEELIGTGEIHGGMIPKARAAAAVVKEKGVPVVILSGSDPAALADWAAGRPAGTRIVPAPHSPPLGR